MSFISFEEFPSSVHQSNGRSKQFLICSYKVSDLMGGCCIHLKTYTVNCLHTLLADLNAEADSDPHLPPSSCHQVNNFRFHTRTFLGSQLQISLCALPGSRKIWK
ncbi:predicted protein [Sclerotinia sclerotiorum 1980 UF-70]|uniref:Uncharacterized protein n=1 Tax=Sclerotinia sclerotiorum (strain ATCC 18683 / 1980 / Ss-1) TaxID=665079 RepID=A7EPT8_SCLS1|nr:predicted protein [Sclerotinia sclerotiorum 1980 UF-70]EDO04854.1 predicted protein [Sclerotinia sclerotiorum 1980 UF-70]